jgi:hypothetical protein
MGSNVMSGVGCERDQEIAGGFRGSPRAYNSGIAREREMYQLGLSHEIRHRDFAEGDLVSIQGGKIVPLDPALEFAGIIEKIGEDKGKYMASVTTRGAICVKVAGLSAETHQGEKVHAMPAGHTQVFSLANEGVLIGEICAIENLERGMAIVGIRLPLDNRRFELGGPRPSRSGRLA